MLSGGCLARCREKRRRLSRIYRVLANVVLIFGLLRLTSSCHEIFDNWHSGALFGKDDILVRILQSSLNCWNHIWQLHVWQGYLGQLICKQMVRTFVCRNITTHHLQHCFLFSPLRFDWHHHNLFHVEILGANQSFFVSLSFQILLIIGEHLVVGVSCTNHLSYETWSAANTPINKTTSTI